MKFDITADNEPYLNARGKIILNACPGSGKTSAISYKLTVLTKECAELYGDYSGIACLSFTNVAKEEINQKYKSISGNGFHYPHTTLTIDSFINQYITLPFYHLLGKTSKRPVILDTVAFLDDLDFGYFAAKNRQPLRVRYKPSGLKIEIDGTYTWQGSRPNPLIVDAAVFDRFANKIKTWQIDKGYLNNDDSTWIACQLLENYPSIGKSLVERFPYLIIDEAQDTSEIQYKIFDLLVAAGLKNLEFVGDPYQSLYEFREARPDLFLQRFSDTTNWQTLRFNDCRRSSQNIIDKYSALRGGETVKITSTCTHATDHRIKIIRYDVDDLPGLIAKYEKLIDPARLNQILVRGGSHLEQFGVKAVSENPWKSDLAKTLIQAQVNLLNGNTKASIDSLRMFLIEITIPDEEYKIKKAYADELKPDAKTNMNLFEFVRNMPTIDDTIQGWHDKITIYIKSELNTEVDLQLKQKQGALYQKNLKSFFYPEVKLAYPVSTIHKVKGMTFDSVLLVLSVNSSGQNISLSDMTPQTGMPNEKQRMLYVALSRPETLSCIAIPKSITEAQIVAQLGNDIDFI